MDTQSSWSAPIQAAILALELLRSRSWNPSYRDVRLALRTWLKRPGFNSLVVLTLALGIGANAAVFSVVDGVLLRPLPYAEPQKLAVVRTELVETGEVTAKSSPPEVADLRSLKDVFESAGAVWPGPPL